LETFLRQHGIVRQEFLEETSRSWNIPPYEEGLAANEELGPQKEINFGRKMRRGRRAL
jgi:hypothetical protein